MSLQTRITDFVTAVGTDIKTLRTQLFTTPTGGLASLQTTDKSSIVNAINEARTTGGSGTPPAASETTAGILELATLAEVATGTDALRAVTAAGVRQERSALKAEILGAATPATLDTLDELAAALGDDANFATSTSTALGNRLRFDAAQTLTAAQQTQGQNNLAVLSSAAIGNPETDLVAAYTTAKA